MMQEIVNQSCEATLPIVIKNNATTQLVDTVIGSCSRSVERLLNRATKLKAINEQSNDNIMHYN
jgi:hypothetical protein